MRRLARVGPSIVVAAIIVGPALPAAAAVEGGCTATVNGVDVDIIDSLGSPLELTDTDTLIFAGTDDVGTQSVTAALLIGPLTLDTGQTTYGPVEQDFEATIDLDDLAPYGVGLLRFRGTTDTCVAEAWVRVSGRTPFATLAGITAGGLTVGGFAAQLTAIAGRRRSSPALAAAAGLATGAGGAILGQQFGRMQLSYWSLAATVTVAAAIGAGIAFLVASPARTDRRRRKQATMRPRPDTRRIADTAEERGATNRRRPTETRVSPATTVAASGQAPPPTSQGGSDRPYWCYVMAPTDVFHLDDHTRIVATLHPGTWYLAKREVGGWVHVAAGGSAEGWVPHSAVLRQ